MKKELIVRDVNEFLKELNVLDFIEIKNSKCFDGPRYIVKVKENNRFLKLFNWCLFIIDFNEHKQEYILYGFSYEKLDNLSLSDIKKLFDILDIHLVEINKVNINK